MAKFRYQAKAGPGVIKDGYIEADNQFLVVARLRQEGMYPLHIEETRVSGEKSEKISPSDIASFTRQLSDLLCSGFTLSSALATLSSQARTPALQRLIAEIRQGIEHGSEFSAALARHPGSFSGFFVSMVKIGEAGGKLEESLKRLADFKEREEEFVAQLKSALIYPSFLLLVGLVSILVLTAFFIPRLAQLFADFEQVLPLSTRIVISIGSFLGRFWWLTLILSAAAVFMSRSYLADGGNRLLLDSFILRLPAAGDFLRKMESSRFAYALGMLLKSGIPILEGLGIAGQNIANRRLRSTVQSFHEKIRKGQSLSDCLRSERQSFPELLYRMAAVGEESGELAEMLLRAAVTFENEVNRNLKRFVALIEPCLVMFIGGFMIIIVFSILLPVFQLDFFPR